MYMRQERQQQRAYNAVVAREEAQNEQYTEEEAQYRKICAHSYQQQLQGFLRFLRRHNTLIRHNTELQCLLRFLIMKILLTELC